MLARRLTIIFKFIGLSILLSRGLITIDPGPLRISSTVLNCRILACLHAKHARIGAVAFCFEAKMYKLSRSQSIRRDDSFECVMSVRASSSSAKKEVLLGLVATNSIFRAGPEGPELEG